MGKLLNDIDEDDMHALEHTYTFWFMKRNHNARTQESYEKSFKKVGSFGTVEEFWCLYNHMTRPNELPTTSDYHLFKEGIKPLWEDEANKNGGKWIVRLKKGLASRCWEDLLLGLLGEHFGVGDEMCGVVVSIRYQEDIISVWNKSADNKTATNKIRDAIKKILGLPQNAVLEYKYHNKSLQDNSSFRNTDVFTQ